MTNTEARRKLTAAGFTPTRASKKGTLFTIGPINVLVGHGVKDNPHTTREVEMAIRRAAQWEKEEEQRAKAPRPPKIGFEPLTAKIAEHVAASKSSDRFNYHCPLCNNVFKSPGDMAIHASLKHPDYDTPPDTLGRILKTTTYSPPVRPPETPEEHRCAQIQSAKQMEEPTPPVETKSKNPSLMENFEKGRMRKRMGVTQRKKLYRTIIKLRKTLSNKDTVDQLNAMKIPTAIPGDTWKPSMVSQAYMRALRMKAKGQLYIKREKEEPVTVTPKPSSPKPIESPKLYIPASLALMLEDSELSITQKVAVIRAAAPKLPASVALMLDDTDLNDEQKFGVIKSILGIK